MELTSLALIYEAERLKKTQEVTPLCLLQQAEQDASTWVDIHHYPETITLRRMIRLADFAAENPDAWKSVKARHDPRYHNLTDAELAVVLDITRFTLSRHLNLVASLADPSDFPEEEE